MRKKPQLITFFILLALTFAPINAQDDDYHLNIPDTDEYLAHMAEIWAQRGELPHWFDEEAYSLHMAEQLIRLMEATFMYRYADSASATQLITAYEILNQGDLFGYVQYMPFIDIRAWNQRIVRRWLEENSVDLNTVEQVEFGPYTLITERHNLTDPNEDDLLLRVDRNDYVDQWLVVQQGNEYRFRLLTSYYEHSFYPSQVEGTRSGGFIQDVNADGLEEIVVNRWNAYPGSNYIGSIATFTVWGLREGLLVSSQSASNPSSFFDIPQWEFENIDDDAPLELIQNDYGHDNFYCLQHRRQVFDWNGEVYEVIIDETTFEETVGCALRFGQQAMWEHDYEDAIDYYELALARFSGDFAAYDGEQDSVEQFAAYVQERLFIAYMLAGDTVAARVLLDDLREQPLIEDTIAQQLIAIPEDELDPLTVCETAYDFLNDEFDYTVIEQNYRNIPNVGYVEENVHIYFRWRDGLGRPERVACDFPYMLEQIALMTATPPPTATPLPTATPDAILLDEQQAHNDLRQTVYGLAPAILRGDMNAVLSRSEAVLDSPLVGPTSDIALLTRHYRALALQALEQQDKALAEYVTIINTAPDSVWGMLAALHVEADE